MLAFGVEHQLTGVDARITVLQLAELAQLAVGELGPRRTVPTDDVDLADPALRQMIQRMLGDVGVFEPIDALDPIPSRSRPEPTIPLGPYSCATPEPPNSAS